MNLLQTIFGDYRIVGLAGDKSTGKTNNLMALVKDFRFLNTITPIYVYGLNEATLTWLMQFQNVFEISTIEQLSNKKDSLIIIDEFQKLRLNDRRYKELLDKFVDFIYHNNNWCILSCPNLREFNSIIGSKIERWALKSLSVNNLVNGSHLKDIVLAYNGRYKTLNDISIHPGQLLIINNDYERVLELEYIKDIDEKIKNVNIFNLSEKMSDKLSDKKSKQAEVGKHGKDKL